MIGKVLFNGVIIRTILEKKVDRKSKGGILLPDTLDEETARNIDLYKEHPNKGIVIQVGENVTKCKEGDCVYMTNMVGAPIIEDSVYYLHLREHDIAYVVDKDVWETYIAEKDLPATAELNS